MAPPELESSVPGTLKVGDPKLVPQIIQAGPTCFFFDMFFGETGHDDGDEEEQDEDEDEDEDEDDDDDDDDADDDEEDETIEWWILGLCPEMQNAHPIDTVTVNIY